MRFHFGFSKFIKPSKLLYWLGLGFLIILGYFGVVDNAFASTLHEGTNVNLGNYINSYFIDYWAKSSSNGSFGNLQSSTQNISWSSDYYGFDSKNTLVATSTYYNAFRHIEYDINTNVCSGVNGAKSIDLYFLVGSRSPTYITDILTNLGFSNITSPSDIQSIGITPIFSGDGPFAEYSCNLNQYNDGQYTSWGTFEIACIGIPTENVLGYKISYYNNLAYNFEPEELNKTIYSDQPYMLYNIPRKYDYACSDVEPVRPDQPLFPDDITGSSNIQISEGSSGGVSFDSNGSIDYSFIELAYPNTIAQFIQFPLLLANSLVNGHNLTCQPIQIDFSSITRRWGGSNYILTIPCLGNTIQDVFDVSIFGTNTTFYNLIDMFIAFTLLYMLASRMIVLVNMMMSGQDLTGYLFSGTSQVVGADETTGEAILKKRRY